MYPPKFCTFKKPTEPTYPAYLTPETNLVSKIDEIIKRVIELNMANIEKPEEESGESNMMCMHSYGIRHKGSTAGLLGSRRTTRRSCTSSTSGGQWLFTEFNSTL